MREIKFRAWDGKGMITTESKGWSFFGDCVLDERDKGDYEVMQYTGLKDKNGKEIYEGDFLRLLTDEKVNRAVGIVKYDERTFEAKVTYGKGDFDYQDILEYVPKVIEVVGNIHEHTHLLGENSERTEKERDIPNG